MAYHDQLGLSRERFEALLERFRAKRYRGGATRPPLRPGADPPHRVGRAHRSRWEEGGDAERVVTVLGRTRTTNDRTRATNDRTRATNDRTRAYLDGQIVRE